MSRGVYDKVNKKLVYTAGMEKIDIDNTLSPISQNPVENRVIDSEFKRVKATIPDPFWEVVGENATFIINKA